MSEVIGKRAPRSVRLVARMFLLLIALFCLAVPFWLLTLNDQYGLLDDTRAWFDAGSDEGVPVVSGLTCSKDPQSFRSTDRSIETARWSCSLSLGTGKALPQDDPFAGRSHSEGMEEHFRRVKMQMDDIRASSALGGIKRRVPTDRTGERPLLRRLSGGDLAEGDLAKGDRAEGGQPRYGVVWSFGQMLLGWGAWFLTSLLFFLIGVPLLLVAWKAGR